MIVNHTSMVAWVEAMICIPWKVSSWIEMMETMDEYLMVLINSLARGGSIIRMACGMIMCLICCHLPKPWAAEASH